jgi:hypothetical protein
VLPEPGQDLPSSAGVSRMESKYTKVPKKIIRWDEFHKGASVFTKDQDKWIVNTIEIIKAKVVGCFTSEKTVDRMFVGLLMECIEIYKSLGYNMAYLDRWPDFSDNEEVDTGDQSSGNSKRKTDRCYGDLDGFLLQTSPNEMLAFIEYTAINMLPENLSEKDLIDIWENDSEMMLCHQSRRSVQFLISRMFGYLSANHQRFRFGILTSLNSTYFAKWSNVGSLHIAGPFKLESEDPTLLRRYFTFSTLLRRNLRPQSALALFGLMNLFLSESDIMIYQTRASTKGKGTAEVL